MEAEAHALVARAEDGAEVWRYDLPTSVQLLGHLEGTSPWYAIADLDGDGLPEAIASVPLSSTSDHADYDELHVFSTTGKVLWRQRLTDQFTFRAGTFGPPWCAGHVAVYSVAGRPRIAWAQGHHTWWPSPLLILDAFGRRLGTFIHPGQIRTLRVMEVAGRPRLLVGGVANAYRAAFMAVLDGDSVAGHGPAPAFSPFECLDCGDAGPVRYFVFPPSDICTASDFPYNYVRDFVIRGDEVEAFTRESLPGSPLAEMVFGFSRDFELLDARSADSWAAHEALEKAGRLDHSVANCPWYRNPPPVREWRPNVGLVDLRPRTEAPRRLAQR